MRSTWYFDEQNFDKLIVDFIAEHYDGKFSRESLDELLAILQIRQFFST